MAEIDKTQGAAEGAVNADSGLSRRDFVAGVGGAGVGLILGGLVVRGFLLPEEAFAAPASERYLVVDPQRCSGCTTCMLMCSATHYGEANLSLSRIQIETDPFGSYPDGIMQHQCRQCPSPACVEACPTGANHVDTENGNVRTVDPKKCVGCERCIAACPFTPSRLQWNNVAKHSQKCDLCANTPYWNEDGGPNGKQACVEMCPMRAISFTDEVPLQNGWVGYRVNLRKNNDAWSKFLHYATDDYAQL